jgi:hypothetical protein
MSLEYSYAVIIIMLALLGIYYLSPYELRVNEEEDNE